MTRSGCLLFLVGAAAFGCGGSTAPTPTHNVAISQPETAPQNTLRVCGSLLHASSSDAPWSAIRSATANTGEGRFCAIYPDSLRTSREMGDPQPVTSVELQTLRRVTEAMDFGRPTNDNCYNRAHAIWAALGREGLGSKVFKLWLFSSSFAGLSPVGVQTSMTYSGRHSSWDFHVIAVYMDERGELWAVEPMLDREPIPVAQLLDAVVSGGQVAILPLPGDYYLYNTTSLEGIDFFNGYLFQYEGLACISNRLPIELSVDSTLGEPENSSLSYADWIAACPEVAGVSGTGLYALRMSLVAQRESDCEGCGSQCRALFEAHSQSVPTWERLVPACQE